MASSVRDRYWLLSLVLAALLAVAAACGGDGGNDQTPSPEAATGTPEEGSPSPQATGPDPRLPEDFPEDFPQYSRASVSDSFRFGDQLLVTMKTDDPQADVVAFFREALEKAPWKVLIQEDEPNQSLVLIRFAQVDGPISGSVSIIAITGDTPSTDITVRLTLPTSVGSPIPRSTATPAQGEGGSTPSSGS